MQYVTVSLWCHRSSLTPFVWQHRLFDAWYLVRSLTSYRCLLADGLESSAPNSSRQSYSQRARLLPAGPAAASFAVLIITGLSVCLTDCRNLICTSKNVTFPTALILSSSCYCTLFCLFIVCLLPSVFLYFHSPYQVWFDSTFFVKQNYSSWTHHTYHSHPVHRLAVSNPLCALRTRESK